MATVTDVSPGKELPLILRAEIQRGGGFHTLTSKVKADMTLLFEAAIKSYVDNRTCNGIYLATKRKKMFYVL